MPHCFAQRSPTWLARRNHPITTISQRACEELSLSRLPTPIRSLKTYEEGHD
jgi:hypothetical protein